MTATMYILGFNKSHCVEAVYEHFVHQYTLRPAGVLKTAVNLRQVSADIVPRLFRLG
jgi:hypothetical protein